MQIIEVGGKQKGYKTFSARRIQLGRCGLISVGINGVFSRKNNDIMGGVQ